MKMKKKILLILYLHIIFDMFLASHQTLLLCNKCRTIVKKNNKKHFPLLRFLDGRLYEYQVGLIMKKVFLHLNFSTKLLLICNNIKSKSHYRYLHYLSLLQTHFFIFNLFLVTSKRLPCLWSSIFKSMMLHFKIVM